MPRHAVDQDRVAEKLRDDRRRIVAERVIEFLGHHVADSHVRAGKRIVFIGWIIELTIARERAVLDCHTEVIVPAWKDALLHKIEAVLVFEHVKPGKTRVDVEACYPERMVMVPKRGSLLIVVIRHCRGDKLRANISRPIPASRLGKPLFGQAVVN